eukprot:1846072-Lingulodinium_polyedra.AAC.1
MAAALPLPAGEVQAKEPLPLQEAPVAGEAKAVPAKAFPYCIFLLDNTHITLLKEIVHSKWILLNAIQ